MRCEMQEMVVDVHIKTYDMTCNGLHCIYMYIYDMTCNRLK